MARNPKSNPAEGGAEAATTKRTRGPRKSKGPQFTTDDLQAICDHFAADVDAKRTDTNVPMEELTTYFNRYNTAKALLAASREVNQ